MQFSNVHACLTLNEMCTHDQSKQNDFHAMFTVGQNDLTLQDPKQQASGKQLTSACKNCAADGKPPSTPSASSS